MTYFVYKTHNNRIHCSSQELSGELFNDLTYVTQSDVAIDSGKFIFDGNNEIIPMPTSYQEQRIKKYGRIDHQLDKLWHDIDAGLFGAKAKTSEFYTSILTVKQEFPKD